MGTKYKSSKCEYQGIRFDSRKEMNRYITLVNCLANNEISDLNRQVRYVLIPKQKGKIKVEQPITYVADFTYLKDGELVVEDVKSSYTRKLPTYIMKRKMMLYFHKIEITEYE